MDESPINLVVQVEPPEPVPVERLEAAIRWLLEHEGAAPDASLSLVLSDDETVHGLNRQYRGVDAPTDVLSFPVEHDAPFEDDTDLGDLIIAVPYLARQAKAQGHTFADELLLAAIHGTLHLLGYDHDTRENEDAMWTIQAQALAAAGVQIDVPRFFEGGLA
jgi:probable rRNA maturation factor